jgi:hypothetical protein
MRRLAISLVDRASSSARANSDQARHISCHWGHPLLKKLHIFGAVVREFLLGDSLSFFGCVFVCIFQPYISCSKYISVLEITVCWTVKCILNKARI